VISAGFGHSAVVRCLIEEFGADVNLSAHDGITPLMIAANKKRYKVVAYLMRHDADPQICSPEYGTAVDVAKMDNASTELIAYLEAKTHCSSPACGGAGIRKCTGCKQARYCGQACQLAHRPVHKLKCKRAPKDKDTEKY
jgi:hypothetical protein